MEEQATVTAPHDEPDWAALKAPFPSSDIEWRESRSGFSSSGQPYIMVLAYITSRAVQDRLDEVVGPGNWQTTIVDLPKGGKLYGISIRVGGEWVTKWDGAGPLQPSKGLSESDAVKGEISNAEKRAAVQWGIGRYLYKLESNFAEIFTSRKSGANFKAVKGKVNGKDKSMNVWWLPPVLPPFAIPKGESNKPQSRAIDFSGESIPEPPSPPEKKPEPPAGNPPETPTEATPEQQLAWIDSIEDIKSYEQLKGLEKVVTAESTIMPDESRRTLVRQICMRSQKLMPKSDKESQDNMLKRIGIYAERYSWMPAEEAKQLKDILRAAWS